MVTAISSKPHSASAFDRLGLALAMVSEPRAVLAVRVLDLERVAWREGRRRACVLERRATSVFARVCRRTLRPGDALAHESGSDVMLAGLLAPIVAADVPRIARAVVKELAAGLRRGGFAVEAGWTMYERGDDPQKALRDAAWAALARGRSERERFDFFATIGHEMRTPLMSIDGYLSALLECELDAGTRRHFIEVAQGEGVRLRRLVEGMYALSLIDLDAEMVPAASCDAQHAVERACDAIFPVAARRKIRLRVRSRVHCAIPLAAEHAVQIFVSILENAVKHGYENGRVDVFLEERGGELSIVFDDDGPGVAAADRTRIFEPLARGRDAAAAGHGLGLAIVRATLERIGGDVTVGRSSLAGARFVVQLPRAGVPESTPRGAGVPEFHDGITLRSS